MVAIGAGRGRMRRRSSLHWRQLTCLASRSFRARPMGAVDAKPVNRKEEVSRLPSVVVVVRGEDEGRACPDVPSFLPDHHLLLHPGQRDPFAALVESRSA